MRALENAVPPTVVAALFGLLMWLTAKYVPGIELAHWLRLVMALLILAAGASFCLAGVMSFRRAQTTVNPLKPDSASALVRSGVYQYSRNPMYVGFALGLLAWAAYLASPIAVFGVFGFVWYMNRFQIAPEERALVKVFGGDYETYLSQVRRWL